MRILVFTNMYPYASAPFYGSFVHDDNSALVLGIFGILTGQALENGKTLLEVFKGSTEITLVLQHVPD